MKRLALTLLAGLILGAGTVWFVLRRPSEEAPSAKTENEKKPAAADPLHLDAETQKRVGLVVERLAATNLVEEIHGYARVLDAAPLVQQVNDLAVARVAQEASRKEWERLKALFAQGQNASARALESGEAAWKHDEAMASGAEARLLSAWGPTLVRRPDLAGLASRLAQFDAALVRVELPVGEGWEGEPRDASIASLSEPARRTPMQWLGPAPSTDPLTQGRAFLALVASQGFVPGTTYDALLTRPGPGLNGTFVPATAVVRNDGGSFVYGTRDGSKFARIPINTGHPMTGGWLMTTGVTNGDRVVVTGAQVLLSNELKSQGGEE